MTLFTLAVKDRVTQIFQPDQAPCLLTNNGPGALFCGSTSSINPNSAGFALKAGSPMTWPGGELYAFAYGADLTYNVLQSDRGSPAPVLDANSLFTIGASDVLASVLGTFGTVASNLDVSGYKSVIIYAQPHGTIPSTPSELNFTQAIAGTVVTFDEDIFIGTCLAQVPVIGDTLTIQVGFTDAVGGLDVYVLGSQAVVPRRSSYPLGIAAPAPAAWTSGNGYVSLFINNTTGSPVGGSAFVPTKTGRANIAFMNRSGTAAAGAQLIAQMDDAPFPNIYLFKNGFTAFERVNADVILAHKPLQLSWICPAATILEAFVTYPD